MSRDDLLRVFGYFAVAIGEIALLYALMKFTKSVHRKDSNEN